MVGVQQIVIEWIESMNGYHEGPGPQEEEGELDSVGKQKVGMVTLIVAIMYSKFEEMTSNVNLLTFDIDRYVFFPAWIFHQYQWLS